MRTKKRNLKMIDWLSRINWVMNVLYDSIEGIDFVVDENTAWIVYKEDRLGFEKEIVEQSSALAILYEIMEFLSNVE